MLWNAIVFAVQNPIMYVISQLLKYIMNYIPCLTFVVIQQPFDIFKKKQFWLGFFDDTGKFIK